MLANCFQPEQTDYADADRLKQQFMIILPVRSSSVIYSYLLSSLYSVDLIKDILSRV